MHAWGPASGFWTSGTIASSSALVGFGLDSVIAVKEGRDAWRGKGRCAPAAGPDGCGRRPEGVPVKPAQNHPFGNTSIAPPQESHLRAAPLCGRISGAFGAFS